MFPITVTFKNLDPSPALEARIREHAEKLGEFEQRIERCAIVVESPHRHRRRGREFQVHIHVAIPGVDIEVSRDPGVGEAHQDAYVAVRDAFVAARRQLDEHARRAREAVR